MLNLHISLTSLAAILWSGMIVIAGSIWVLSSQVRKLSDLLEEQAKADRRDGARLADHGTMMSQPHRRPALRVVDRPAARAN